MNLIIETEELFPYHYYPFLIIQPLALISSQEKTKFQTFIIITSDSTFGKLNSNIKLFHKAMTEEGKAIAEKNNQAYPNDNVKIFSRSEFLAKIKKTKDDNFVFITKYLGYSIA